MLKTTLLAVFACASILAKEVGSLPGLTSSPCWKQDAGYLPVSDGKQLYYWYHEATM
jgi:hypothetical protein